MIAKSMKHVELRDATYLGMWQEWKFIIPFLGEDMEIPVSQGNPKVADYFTAKQTGLPNVIEYITATVKNNELTFEVKI
jgi:hypothetical protein